MFVFDDSKESCGFTKYRKAAESNSEKFMQEIQMK